MGVPAAGAGRPTGGLTSSAGVRPAARDHPSAYVPGDRRRALAAGLALPGVSVGAALFADISGFTSLTDALAQELGSQRASEVLTGHLNRVFHAVIDEIDRFGGDVIYFSGDAITCWIEADDGSRACASGLAMQEAIAREGRIETPGGLTVELGLKVAVAVGSARRFLVGDPAIQLIDVLAGALVDRLAATEQLVERGEVAVDEATVAALGAGAELAEQRSSAEAGSVYIVRSLSASPPEARPLDDDPETFPEELARQWLLPAVYERLSSGSGEFLAELRPAYPFFVSFGGIDYDADDEASAKLDAFVREAQHVLSAYGGNLLQLTLGDKGAYLYGVFGTPHAHEDDAERACAAALELGALAPATAARDLRIGISYGRLRSGTYGHLRRRTFVCLGDAVNLAARLMGKAPAGEIYVSELVKERAGDRFRWGELEPLKLKGKPEPVPASSLLGSGARRSRRVIRHVLPLVGRAAELERLEQAYERARVGSGGVLGISAEAGMGKSRLVAEFVRALRGRGETVAFGECQSLGTATSYLVWREIWRTLFGLSENAPVATQKRTLERALRRADASLTPRLPLLGPLLGLELADNELTSSFDAKLRKTSLENMLADYLRARAARQPLLIVLEDCHWLDPLSRDLLEVVARVAGSSALLVVVAYRPEAAAEGIGLARLTGIEELALELLSESEMREVVLYKLGAQAGDGGSAPSAALSELVVGRAQGNPFYAEELLNFISSRGVDPGNAEALAALELPESLYSLVLGRIDTLSEQPRRTLKVASVVGRVFRAPAIPGVYPEIGSLEEVRRQLETLRLQDLVIPDRLEDESHLFKHAVTQEVAYESLPYALRGTLHVQVGRYLEAAGPEQVEQNLDLLAHHYWRGDDEEKKRHYLRRAANAAKAAYANTAAIDYYRRLVPLLAERERVDALLELGAVLELVGRWEEARETDSEALELAHSLADERTQAWCETALAEVARKQGRFEEAAERLGRAAEEFAACADEQGLGRVAHLAGTLAAQRGDHAEARERYEESLAIRRRLGDRAMMASVLSNLGVVAEYDGELPLARGYHLQALALREELADRWAIAVSMTNLGMIALLEGDALEASGRFEEAMRLNKEVGDAWMVAITDNNLGNAKRDLAAFPEAASHYSAALLAYREHADSWGMAFLLEDVGLLAAECGEPELALRLLGASDRLREEIGSPRAEPLEDAIGRVLAPAAAGLGEHAAQIARASGRELDFDAACELAGSLVRGIVDR